GPSTASLVRTGQALPNSELRWGGCQRTAAGTFGRRPPSARQSVRRGAGFTHFSTARESLFRESDASVTRATGPFPTWAERPERNTRRERRWWPHCQAWSDQHRRVISPGLGDLSHKKKKASPLGLALWATVALPNYPGGKGGGARRLLLVTTCGAVLAITLFRIARRLVATRGDFLG